MEASIRAPRSQGLWILAIAGTIAAALAGVFAGMSWDSYGLVLSEADDQSSNLAFSVEQFVARTIETVDLSLQMTVDEIEGARAHARPAFGARLAERLRHAPQITGLAVIGADGRLVAGAGPYPDAGADLAAAPYVRAARAHDGLQFTLGDPAGREGGGKQTIISRRFLHRDGSVGGVVAASLNSDYLNQFFYSLRIGEQGIIALSLEDGTELARRPYLEDFIGRNFATGPIFQEWLPVASSGVFPMRYPHDGLWRVVGYQRVEKLPLVVEVALSRAETLADWRSRTWVLGIIVAALLLILAIAARTLHLELRARLSAHAQLRETVGELERSRLAAEQASRVKSEFMAHMSHELRTPLNAIIGFSEMIREALIGPVSARYRDYARDIHSSGSHLLRLINDVLDLSKVEAGKLELKDDTVDLTKLVDECRRLFAERVAAGGLRLAIDLAPGLPPLRADELRLKQIVLNLLSNSVKFTAPGGRITLAARRSEEGGVALAVSDTGIGMTAEEVPLALEPFRQLDGAFNRRFEGTGLGLPLARRLAELHGGTLAIDSAKGVGTTVTLALPASRVLDRALVPFASTVVS